MLGKNKNRILLPWLGVDFANSILFVNGGIYFSRWLIDDLGAPEYTYNAIVSVSTLIVVLLAIPVGRAVDRQGPNGMLAVTVIVMAIAASVLSGTTVFEIDPDHLVLVVSVLFLIILLGYQLSLIAYNSFLSKTALSSDVQRNSGLASGANWLGSFVGILLTLAFVAGLVSAEFSGNKAAFLPATTVTLVVSSIAITLLWRRRDQTQLISSVDRSTQRIPAMLRTRSFFLYGLGALLILDVIFSVQLNLSQALSSVHGVGSEKAASMFLIILLGAAAGSFLCSYVRVPLRVRIGIAATALSALTVGVVLLPFSTPLFLALFLLSGLAVGLLEPALREGFTKFLLPEEAGVGFSLYSIIGRASVLLGPVIFWALLASIDRAADAYKAGFGVLAIIALIGGCLIYYSQPNAANTGV